MSNTFSLACPETKKYVGIGMGYKVMTTFYTGEPEVTEALRKFLNDHLGKTLIFNDDDVLEIYNYDEVYR